MGFKQMLLTRQFQQRGLTSYSNICIFNVNANQAYFLYLGTTAENSLDCQIKESRFMQ